MMVLKSRLRKPRGRREKWNDSMLTRITRSSKLHSISLNHLISEVGLCQRTFITQNSNLLQSNIIIVNANQNPPESYAIAHSAAVQKPSDWPRASLLLRHYCGQLPSFVHQSSLFNQFIANITQIYSTPWENFGTFSPDHAI